MFCPQKKIFLIKAPILRYIYILDIFYFEILFIDKAKQNLSFCFF